MVTQVVKCLFCMWKTLGSSLALQKKLNQTPPAQDTVWYDLCVSAHFVKADFQGSLKDCWGRGRRRRIWSQLVLWQSPKSLGSSREWVGNGATWSAQLLKSNTAARDPAPCTSPAYPSRSWSPVGDHTHVPKALVLCSVLKKVCLVFWLLALNSHTAAEGDTITCHGRSSEAFNIVLFQRVL